MRIVVTANGTDLNAPASPVFGRCPTYIFVDTETMAFEALENPAIGAPGGAGIQAAQFVVEHGAQAVVTGNTGPNAFNVLQSANVSVYLSGGGTVREAVEAYTAGQLFATSGASAEAHAGTGGMDGGMAMERSMGRGAAVSSNPPAPAAAFAGSREDEMAALRDLAGDLRKQLAELLARLDRLERGE
jgi:predicted Fe-Mo cluster-binding NifX family protein